MPPSPNANQTDNALQQEAGTNPTPFLRLPPNLSYNLAQKKIAKRRQSWVSGGGGERGKGVAPFPLWHACSHSVVTWAGNTQSSPALANTDASATS